MMDELCCMFERSHLNFSLATKSTFLNGKSNRWMLGEPIIERALKACLFWPWLKVLIFLLSIDSRPSRETIRSLWKMWSWRSTPLTRAMKLKAYFRSKLSNWELICDTTPNSQPSWVTRNWSMFWFYKYRSPNDLFSVPESILLTILLPAPLVPINPSICPLLTLKELILNRSVHLICCYSKALQQPFFSRAFYFSALVRGFLIAVTAFLRPSALIK